MSRAKTTAPEIKPDRELLDLMVEDHRRADPSWHATPYWTEIAEPLIECFRNPHNVRNFRNIPERTGIRSVSPANAGYAPVLAPRARRVAKALRVVPGVARLIRGYEATQVELIARHQAAFTHNLVLSQLLVREQDPEHEALADFMVGLPDDVVEIDGRRYSFRGLGYQHLYGEMARRLDVNRLGLVVELGSGYGGQAEVFLRKLPRVQYVAIDIPPWLYLAELYLQAIFPGQVVGYRETRGVNVPVEMRELLGDRRVAIVPSWNWPHLRGTADLFWNSKSIQEMEGHAPVFMRRALENSRCLFLHAYGKKKVGRVHQPEDLRNMVLANGGFREVFFEPDLYAWQNSISMMFVRV